MSRAERTCPVRDREAVSLAEGVSASRLFWENKLGFLDFKGVTVPKAVSTFPNELYQAPRAWAEQAYPLVYFNQAKSATTSPPGSSPASSRPRCGQRSGLCAKERSS